MSTIIIIMKQQINRAYVVTDERVEAWTVF